MITATEARKLTNENHEPVSGSVEFKAIMVRIERDIRKAIADGRESIEIISYLLPVFNNCKYPSFINRDKIDNNHFWWPFVKTELEANGFKISKTIVSDHYTVAW
jgi:hypothetical protein